MPATRDQFGGDADAALRSSTLAAMPAFRCAHPRFQARCRSATASALSLACGQFVNDIQEPFGVRRCCRNPFGTNHGKDPERVTPFAIGTRLALLSSLLQARCNLTRRYFLDVGVLRQTGFSEPLPKEHCHVLRICKKPRLHALDHEVHVVVGSVCRTLPPIPPLQMRPRTLPLNGFFTVHQQQYRALLRFRFGQLGAKFVKRRISRPTSIDPRHPTGKFGVLEELSKPFATIGFQLSRVPTAFNVNRHCHQRFPPMSPELHSCPSR